MPKSLVDPAQLEALVAPLCRAEGVELVDVRLSLEQGGQVLRVLIELPGAESLPPGTGVTLDDCTRVSRAVSHRLDQDEDAIPGNYRLEVSSPGIERPLTKPLDFERYAGREVHVSTHVAHDGRKNFAGILGGLRGDQVLLRDAEGDELALPLREVDKARLIFRF